MSATERTPSDEIPDTLPRALRETAEDFRSVGERDRLQLLLEFSDELPEMPERYHDDPALLEPVPECQSPVALIVEIGADGAVHPHVQAPVEAPTTRGFASILVQGLDGLSPAEVLAVPSDYPYELGLAHAVSLLRLHGMVAMLSRIKGQVRRKTA
ncbi:SufE family protein [Pseudoclavibacter caeni]|uniref:SufE family protein n=1 Tax=Pseudoclavibacter caeni TaxID=908846 RepID=A0A7C8FRG2_9MICO|nr:SufE family protein [Pseudoclavibacter caeni]KAB1633797.1 SufE family protein [Pseudoclavibacter caeni]NYJ96161.1 cysteine desulfuration protein SufE [Pseudoclavibacter caeni]